MLCSNISEPRPLLKERTNTKQFKLYMRNTRLLFSLYSLKLRYDIFTGDVLDMGTIAKNLLL